MSADLERSVYLMSKVGRCLSPSFSPDGRQLAFISDLNGTPQVWRVAVEGGWPELVTATDDPISKVRWSPADDWLAFQLAPGGGMNQQIYIIRPDGSDMRLLTPGGQSNNWLNLWAKDGRSLAVMSNRRSADAMDAYLIDIETGEMRLIVTNEGTGNITGLNADGTQALLTRVRYRGDSNVYLVDVTTGDERLLTPHDPPGSFDSAQFSHDERSVYLISNGDRDMRAFAQVTLEGDMHILAERDDAELDDFVLSSEGRQALLVWNSAGRSQLELFDLVAQTGHTMTDLPADILLSPTMAPTGDCVALQATGAAQPSDIWLMDMDSHTPRQITRSPHPGVKLEALASPELVTYEAHDGLALSGWLYLPQDFAAPGPMVFSFHGGPEGQERPTFNPTYQALVAQGIAVFAPNVRGSSGFGKRFVNLDNGALRFDAIRDIEATAQHFIDRQLAAPGKLGIMGGSYGGYMTMAGITEYPDLFAAAANLYGMVNFKTFFAHTEPWMAAISKIEYGDPDTEGDLLDRLSPLYKLDHVKAATLVLHGATDTNVPVIEAEQAVDHLKKQGTPVDYILFPDEGHGFLKEANRITAAAAIVRWFVKYLGVER